MRKKMFAALGIILMLFAFVACQGEPTTISEEQAKANGLAADYISSIRYAEVLNVAFKNNNSNLTVENATADSVTVTFNNYTGDAVPATGDIKGIKSGSLRYTFTETKAATGKGYTIETAKPLVFILKDGSTAADTIAFKISGSCEIELTTDSSNKITGVKSAEFGEVTGAEEITVGGDMPVALEDIEIDIDNSTPSTEQPTEPTEKIYKLEKNTNVSEIKDFATYDGIKGNGKDGEGKYVLTIDKAITISKDFTFDNVILDGDREKTDNANKPNTTAGIIIDAGSSGVEISVKDSAVRDFGIAFFSDNINEDDTLSNGLLTMEITGSSFTNCYKGLYATNLKDLTVTDSEFTNMGTDSSAPTNPDNPSTPDLMNRSGSAFDINQMVAGNSIVIEDSTFSQCGAAQTETGTTSGAIKVKIRGGENEKNYVTSPNGDIPKDANGSFVAGLTVKNCSFNGNRMDIVLGTDKNVDSADFEFTYTAGSGTKEPKIEDNAENTLVIVKNTDYSDIDDEISNYAGIRGTSDKPTISIAAGQEITPVDAKDEEASKFVLRSIKLEGSATSPDATGKPVGIDLSSLTKDITLTIADSEIKNFGIAIMSGIKPSTENGKIAMLTLNIEDSDFSNCYKGLYVTNLQNLTVTDSTFTDMGLASKPSTETDGTQGKISRSGAAFDINQMVAGNDVKFSSSTFTNCGGSKETGENEEITSGAIKVKLRGGTGDDFEPTGDIPKAAKGSLVSFVVENTCVFADSNRADIVIGTGGIESTGLSEKIIEAIPEKDAKDNKIDIENNSEAVTETNGQ